MIAIDVEESLKIGDNFRIEWWYGGYRSEIIIMVLGPNCCILWENWLHD